jgi:hypothetical protein
MQRRAMYSLQSRRPPARATAGAGVAHTAGLPRSLEEVIESARISSGGGGGLFFVCRKVPKAREEIRLFWRLLLLRHAAVSGWGAGCGAAERRASRASGRSVGGSAAGSSEGFTTAGSSAGAGAVDAVVSEELPYMLRPRPPALLPPAKSPAVLPLKDGAPMPIPIPPCIPPACCIMPCCIAVCCK